ncbi:MAG: ABC transporter permease [Desulfobacteraceae bacterium]|jgi:putative ABC transport system permease protein
MLKNYFTIAINNLLKNKLYSVINITGLAIGLAACIVIALYVKDQFSFDKQWKDSERIYRVNVTTILPGRKPIRFAITPLPAMPLLQRYFNNDIEKSTRTVGTNKIIDTGTVRFEDFYVMIDPTFIKLFKLDVLAGSLETTLEDPGNIALSSEVARRCFGNQNPVGKIIGVKTSGTGVDYKVTAVYRLPGNTVMDLPMISRLVEASLPPMFNKWYNLNTSAYFKLKKGIDIETLKTLTPAFINKNVDLSGILPDPGISASDILKIEFQNLEKAHLNSSWDTSRAGGSKTAVISFAGISLLILLIGCINFIIMTTANATKRAREVAMRKVVGAKRKQLIVQFLGESVFQALMAIILSLGIIEIIIPVFETIVGKSFLKDYTSPSVLLPLLALLFIVGICGGIYPAIILSGFRPSDTLKANQSKETNGSVLLRNILVTVQFAVCIILLIVTVVIFTQVKYSFNRDPGYNREKLLVINKIDLHSELRPMLEALKQELLNLTNVSDVCFSEVQPSQQYNNNRIYYLPEQPGTSHVIFTTSTGFDYFTTYQIPIIAGRNYSVERDVFEDGPDLMTLSVDSNVSKKYIRKNIIINQSAVRKLGFSNAREAIGKTLNSNISENTIFTIIGIVEDNHLFSINALPRAEIYIPDPGRTNVITVRFSGSPKAVLEQVKSVWKKVMGNIEISTVFVDQLLLKEFEQEQKEVKILVSFSLLAILISCMGLFGSASFTVERRTREIGLRKVMGAKVKNIISLLLWQFSKPVLIANIIAWPIAIFAMQSWLERFPYRFNPLIMIAICLVSGLIALLIALFTVVGNTTRIAKSNPVKALRYE